MEFYFYSQLLQEPKELYQGMGKNFLLKGVLYNHCGGSNNMKVSVEFGTEALNVNTIIILFPKGFETMWRMFLRPIIF